MLDRLTANLQFHGQALMLRAERQQVLAANIANADTPNYQARDFDFSQALARASGQTAFAAGLPLAVAGSGSGMTASPTSAGISSAGIAGTTAASGASATATTVSLASSGITDARHLPLRGPSSSLHSGAVQLAWRKPEQPSIDGNTVDMDRERANFADNSLRYEATLRFINGNVRNTLSAIRGD